MFVIIQNCLSCVIIIYYFVLYRIQKTHVNIYHSPILPAIDNYCLK